VRFVAPTNGLRPSSQICTGPVRLAAGPCKELTASDLPTTPSLQLDLAALSTVLGDVVFFRGRRSATSAPRAPRAPRVAAVGRRPVGSDGALVAVSAAIGRRSRCSFTGGGGGAVSRSRERRNTLCVSCGSFGGAAAGGCPRDWWTVYLVFAVVLRSPRGRMSWARSCTSVHQRAAVRHVAHAVRVLQRAGVPPGGARALSRRASVGVVCVRVHQRTAARHGAQEPELQRAVVPRLVLTLLLELQRAVGPPVVLVLLLLAGGGASVGAGALVRDLAGGGAALCARALASARSGASGGARALARAAVGGGAAAGRYCE